MDKIPESGQNAGDEEIVDNKHPPKKNRFGQPGAPRSGPGYPKGVPRIKFRLEKLLSKKAPEAVFNQLAKIYPATKKLSIYEAIDLGVVIAAMSRQPWAVNYVADHTDGPVSQKINLGGQEGNQLPQSEIDAKLIAIINSLAKNEKDKKE
jgi:hypothetical protein